MLNFGNGSWTWQEVATLLFSNFFWDGVDLSLHYKACDVLFVQEIAAVQ